MTVLNRYAKDHHGHEERKNRKGLPAIARQTEPPLATLNTLTFTRFLPNGSLMELRW